MTSVDWTTAVQHVAREVGARGRGRNLKGCITQNSFQESARLVWAWFEALGCLMRWGRAVVDAGPRRPGAVSGKAQPVRATASARTSDLAFFQAITRLPPAVCRLPPRSAAARSPDPSLRRLRPCSCAVRVASCRHAHAPPRFGARPDRLQPCSAAESSTASHIVFERRHNTP